MTSDRSGFFPRIAIVAVFLATWALTFSLATWALSRTANAQAVDTGAKSPTGDLTYYEDDLIFILQSILISEEHAKRFAEDPTPSPHGCEHLSDILPNNSIHWGLRTTDGSCNNLNPTREHFGRADEFFPTSNERKFPELYQGTGNVSDPTPRLISHLIVNQSADNPAVVAAAADEACEEIGPDITGDNQYFCPNAAPDEGLSAPVNAYMTFFGQFFDHGLDLINKGNNGVVSITVPADDPLQAIAPGAPMLMSRATQYTDDEGNRVFINRTTPHVDQQQTYGSHASAQILLRHYELGSAAERAAIAQLEADAAAAQATANQAATNAASAAAAAAAARVDSQTETLLETVTATGDNRVEGREPPPSAGTVEARRADGSVIPNACSTENDRGRWRCRIDDLPAGTVVRFFDVVQVPGAADPVLEAAAAAAATEATTTAAAATTARADAVNAAAALRPRASGRLLNGTAENEHGRRSGMSTWADMKQQARDLLGLALDDADGLDLPQILADPYGKFIRGDNGMPQLMTATGPVETSLTDPVDPATVNALRTAHSFFIDVSHSANPEGKTPDVDSVLNPRTDRLSGQVTRGIREDSPAGTYDNELLEKHFMCGDGRCNENIALTAIHHIFHGEHNRLTSVAKRTILDYGVLEFLNEWLLTPATQEQLDAWTGLPFPSDDASKDHQEATRVAVDALGLDWNGERIFQIAKFATEMQYNRIVFDEFAPTLSGLKDDFEDFHNTIDPSITAEFSQSVYRFGHSMLTDTVDRFDRNYAPITDAGAVDPETASEQLGLFEAFLNPLAFYNSDADGNPTVTPDEGAGDVIRGITRTQANEIDEFVTGALQNNLIGLPLDLGAINIARGRDVGNPTLNAARRRFHEITGSEQLKPYISWMDYGDNLRHEPTLVNFIAAYGTHPTVQNATTYAGKRAAACAIVGSLTPDSGAYCADKGFSDGSAPVPVDSRNFLFSRGTWRTPIGSTPITGIEDIDFWNGGLAEERQPFGGYLGSTHNFVFENQMERLQNGDRHYYLKRTGSIPMLGSLESNTFSSLVMRNTDIGEYGGGLLPAAIFTKANYYMEVDQAEQHNEDLGNADPEPESELFSFWIRDAELRTTDIEVSDPSRFLQTTGGDHYTIGGTSGDDTMVGGIGDDTFWGRDGNDRIEGGDGADHVMGGPGNDIITDLGGPDVIEGGSGDDAIHSGNEEDVIFGDAGNDVIVNSSEFAEIFGGDDDDFIYDGYFLGHTRGGRGDDWIENLGGGEDLFQGDMGKAAEGGEPGIKGNDVGLGWDGNNDWDMENGDDIVIDGPGIDRVEGQLGFDWVSFQHDPLGVFVELSLTIFDRPVQPPSNATVLNRYDRVEGVSGSPHSDVLIGTDNSPGSGLGNELVVTERYNNFELITGYDELVPVTERRPSCEDIQDATTPCLLNDPINGLAQSGWTGGEIIVGGGGSDLIDGKRGDDIIDGDKALVVGISTPNPEIMAGELAIAVQVAEAALADAQSALNAAAEADAAADTQAADHQATADPLNAAAAAAGAQADSASDAAAQAATNLIAATAAVGSAQNTANAHATAQQAAADAHAAAQTASTEAQAAAQTAQAAVDSAAQAASDAADARAAAQTASTNAAAAAIQANTQALDLQNQAIEALIAALDPDGTTTLADFQALMNEAQAAALAANTADMAASDAAMALSSASMEHDSAQAGHQAAIEGASGALQAASTALQNVQTALATLTAATAQAEASAAAHVTAQNDAADAQATSTLAIALAQQAQDTATNAQNGATAAQDIANASAAAAAATQAALDAANLTLADAQSVLSDAQAALAEANPNIVVDSLHPVIAAVFDGFISPSELSISRVISDHDELNADTDVVTFSGNVSDYTIEAGVDGVPADITGDGYIEVVDMRDGVVNQGRKLLARIERLRFSDDTIELLNPGQDAPTNSLATGSPEIAGEFEVGGVLRASVGTIADPDGFDPESVHYRWESELEPGESGFSPITRLEGANGTGDPFTVQGNTITLTVNEAALRVRVTAFFQDDAGVFEIRTSEPVHIANCDGCPIPEALLGVVPATFTGQAADIDGGTVAFENASRSGLPRFDITIPNVSLDLFENTGFGAVLTAADEVAVDSFELTFTDSLGMVTGSFTPEIVAIADETTGAVDQATVNVLFSIRGDDVTPLVVPPSSTASLTVNGVEVANAVFEGDSNFEDAVGVVIALVNGEVPVDPELVGVPVANFIGEIGDIASDTVAFENASRLGGPRFDVTIPDVALTLFENHGFPTPITVEDEIAVDRFELVFESPTAGVTGAFSGEIVAIELLDEAMLPTGEADQDSVNVSFSIRGAPVALLVDGLTIASVRIDGVELARELFFGNSAEADATEVRLMLSPGELAAAAALQVAIALGDEAEIAQRTADLETAVAEALAALPLVAPEPEPGVIPAVFLGDSTDLEGLAVQFQNNSRVGVPRLDITITDVPIELFEIPDAFAVGETLGCGAANDLSIVCPGDEVAVDSFTATFTDIEGDIIRVFGLDNVQIVAQEILALDGAPLGPASQEALWVLFSIRFEDVAPLVPGASTVTVAVDGVPVASASLVGESSLNDAQGVLVSAVTSLAPGVIARDVAAEEAAEAAVDTVRTPATEGVVDRRGRIRIEGSCGIGGQASAPDLVCDTSEDGTFSCRGRGLERRREIAVTCSGGAAPAVDAEATAAETAPPAPTVDTPMTGRVDSRGNIRLRGVCTSGSAAAGADVPCTTRRSGSFTCRGRDLPVDQEVTVTCQ